MRVGGTLSGETVPKLRCRVVAGSANNRLAEPEAGDLLQARGILYAPDYVINVGGAVAIVGLEQLGWSADDVEAAVARIGETLREIYGRAEVPTTRRRRQPPTHSSRLVSQEPKPRSSAADRGCRWPVFYAPASGRST